MANYVYNHIFITGSKQAVVNFLNRGLKGSKCPERVSVRMTGEQIVAVVNGLQDKCIAMDSYLPRPKTFNDWDTTNPMKDFMEWYKEGCVGYFNHDKDEENRRKKDICDFMAAHPEVKRAEDALRMMHPDIDQQYAKYVRGYKRAKAYQKKKYGVVGWYDWNRKNYGCKWPMPFLGWDVKKESEDSLCLHTQMQTPWSPPVAFCRFINNMEGLTVYMYGSETCEFGFSYNGKTDEAWVLEPSKEPNYKKRMRAYKAAHKNDEDYDPEHVEYEVADEMIADFIDEVIAEIEAEL